MTDHVLQIIRSRQRATSVASRMRYGRVASALLMLLEHMLRLRMIVLIHRTDFMNKTGSVPIT